MEVAQALAELSELSSQVKQAVVLGAGGAILGSTGGDGDATEGLARSALELLSIAGDLHGSADEVTRVEVELAGGAVFVLCEEGRTIAATTGPQPTAGLVAYDLRTCLAGISDPEKPKRSRSVRKPKVEEGTPE